MVEGDLLIGHFKYPVPGPSKVIAFGVCIVFLARISPIEPTTITPQLPFKRPQMPSNRDPKALNGATLGALGMYHIALRVHSPKGPSTQIESPTWLNQGIY